jgi:hypothetical protein
MYGIKIYNSVNTSIYFLKNYKSIMDFEMIREAKIFYENINDSDKKNIKFQIHKKCKSIYNDEEFMIWWNISLDEFIKIINI